MNNQTFVLIVLIVLRRFVKFLYSFCQLLEKCNRYQNVLVVTKEYVMIAVLLSHLTRLCFAYNKYIGA